MAATVAIGRLGTGAVRAAWLHVPDGPSAVRRCRWYVRSISPSFICYPQTRQTDLAARVGTSAGEFTLDDIGWFVTFRRSRSRTRSAGPYDYLVGMEDGISLLGKPVYICARFEYVLTLSSGVQRQPGRRFAT